MEPFTLISENFWVIAILVTCINFLVVKDKSKDYIKQNPDISSDYEKLFQHYFFWFNLPWIIMGIGIITRAVPDIFGYFRPQDGNPFVLTWYISIFSLWAVGTYWLLFKGGAEMLVQSPGVLKGKVTSPLLLKCLWVVCVLWGIAAVIFLYNTDVSAFSPKI